MRPEAAQGINTAIQNPDISAHAQRDMDRVGANNATANDNDLAGINTRYATEQNTEAAVGFLKVIRTSLDRHASSDF